MKSKILTTIFCLFCSITSYASNKPNIVTTITPISSIVAMLVSDKVNIKTIANSNDCPHHYNLKPSDLKKIDNSDIVIYIDDNFDGFIGKLTKTRNKYLIKISDIKNLHILEENNHKNWHIWLDLNNVKIIMQYLAKVISKTIPELQDDINKNLSNAIEKLTKLEEIKKHKLHAIQDIIMLSDSMKYFFANSNVKVLKLYSGTQKSLRYIGKLKKLVEQAENKCITISNEQDPRIYDKVNAKVITLESENWNIDNIDSDTFYNQYFQIITQIEKCL